MMSKRDFPSKSLIAIVITMALSIKKDLSCEACYEPDKDLVTNPSSAGCLVRNSYDEILLVKDTNDQWTFPAGSLDCLEDGEDGAERETSEEADVTVTVGSAICGNVDNDFVGYCCTENPEGQTPSIDNNVDDQITDAQWMNRTQLDSLGDDDLKYPSQRELLENVVDGIYC